MDYKINKNYPYDLSLEYLNKKLDLKNREAMLKIVRPLLDKTQEITQGKYVFFEAKITDKDEDHVKVNGEVFQSELLNSYVEKGDTVYPFIVTSGTEIDEYFESLTNSSDQFMMDRIMSIIVGLGTIYLKKEIKKITSWDGVQEYVPGNGEDWSTEEQTRLFILN